MRDIRLLTLYKQHYMNDYKYELESQFSCWGHFDGMDIKKIEVADHQAPISCLWSAVEEKQEDSYGGYSSQNIGIFRCVSEEYKARKNIETIFWEEYESMPFGAVVFLQLSNSLEYEEISSRIEMQYADWGLKRQKNRKCNMLVYTTFDNVDLVVILSSNSLCHMEYNIKRLQEMDEVEYLYSVMGVSGQYLADSNKIFCQEWNNTRCFLEESISKINLQLIGKGRETIGKMQEKLKEVCQGIMLFSRDFGHTNATITILDTNVLTLLRLMVPNGIITHQNECYGQIVYNIETTFSVETIELEEINFNNITRSVQSNNNGYMMDVWCENLIKKYKQKLESTKANKDLSFSSHYRAIIQTLNALAQYEQFNLGKEIFYLLFPAFYMFERLLDDAESQSRGDYSKHKDIKKTIRHFIDSVHSVMCHTISSRQSFFMIPGYSGISFSVPIKLILMYLWMIDKVARILNDCNCQYECILTPEMESRSMTRLLDFGMNNDNRLICVHIAQRLLFFPKNLMIILAHEVGHYIGKDLRNRKVRTQCILHTMSYALAEMIFPEEESRAVTRDQNYLLEKYGVQLRGELREDALNFLYKGVRKSELEPEYYSERLQDVLIDSSKNFLSTILKEWQRELPQALNDAIREINMETSLSDKDYGERIQYIYNIFNESKNNIQRYLASNSVDKVVIKVMRAYREMFSDMVALVVLECSEDEFTNTFGAEEGVNDSQYRKNDLQVLRERVVHYLKQGHDDKFEQKITNKYRHGNLVGRNLADTIYDYIWMQEWIIRYAKTCYGDLQRRVLNENIAEDVQQVRGCYELFRNSEQATCFATYNCILQRIDEYLKKIDKKYTEIKELNVTESNIS